MADWHVSATGLTLPPIHTSHHSLPACRTMAECLPFCRPPVVAEKKNWTKSKNNSKLLVPLKPTSSPGMPTPPLPLDLPLPGFPSAHPPLSSGSFDPGLLQSLAPPPKGCPSRFVTLTYGPSFQMILRFCRSFPQSTSSLTRLECAHRYAQPPIFLQCTRKCSLALLG